MQKRENNFQPTGICQRLFNFIMSSLTARGLKRVTLGTSASHDSAAVPVEESSGNGKQAGEKSKHIASSEILVEFRHTKKSSPVLIGDQTVESDRDSQIGTHRPSMKELLIVQENGGSNITSVPKSQGKSDSRPFRKELPIVQENGRSNFPSLRRFQGKSDSQNEGKRPQELESPKTIGVQGKGPKKSVSMKESAGEKKKDKNIATEKSTPMTEPEEMKTKPSNVNELSDIFLRTRKAEMRRNLSLDQQQK